MLLRQTKGDIKQCSSTVWICRFGLLMLSAVCCLLKLPKQETTQFSIHKPQKCCSFVHHRLSATKHQKALGISKPLFSSIFTNVQWPVWKGLHLRRGAICTWVAFNRSCISTQATVMFYSGSSKFKNYWWIHRQLCCLGNFKVKEKDTTFCSILNIVYMYIFVHRLRVSGIATKAARLSGHRSKCTNKRAAQNITGRWHS